MGSRPKIVLLVYVTVILMILSNVLALAHPMIWKNNANKIHKISKRCVMLQHSCNIDSDCNCLKKYQYCPIMCSHFNLVCINSRCFDDPRHTGPFQRPSSKDRK